VAYGSLRYSCLCYLNLMIKLSFITREQASDLTGYFYSECTNRY